MDPQLRQAALEYHEQGRPGKISVEPTKQLTNQRDLALAYSPGVAAACEEIVKDPANAFRYTGRANLVGVVTNGTAVLGLGDIGPLAGKPVMEGKAVLFKKFAGIDVFDIEINEKDPAKLVEIIAALEPTFGGINLEDIKAPDCFEVERQLRKRMKIPVFHDDQHGTAIVVGAALSNGLKVVGKSMKSVKLVTSGAGAAALACLDLLVDLGLPIENIWVTDLAGVVFEGRLALMDPDKARFAQKTEARSLDEVIENADIFLGLSAGGVLKPEMVSRMAPHPLVFALANPEPEILPDLAKAARPDAVIATGRTDYPNQVNNVIGFPFIFRGALDVRATGINDAMKIAAANAIAELARERVPEEVAMAYGVQHSFGPEYIIPAPFDPRLMELVPSAVAKAAMDSGVATKPILDMEAYRQQLRARLNPTTSVLSLAYEGARARPKRVLFAEGEEEVVLRAAIAFKEGGYGTPVLVGRDDVYDRLKALGVSNPQEYEVHNSRHSPLVPKMVDFVYNRLQRRGYLRRDVERMINQDRNVFGSALLQLGEADAMITGITRTWAESMRQVKRVIDPEAGRTPFGIHVLVGQSHTVFIADTTVNERPTGEQLADFAEQTAQVARRMGHEPRVAMLSYSTFGNPKGAWVDNIRDAVSELDKRNVGFEYEGEMPPDVALNPKQLANYPFARLSGPANILIMPGLQSAHIAAKLLRELGGDSVIGPMLIGMEKPVQIAPMTSTASELVTLAVLAAGGIAR